MGKREREKQQRRKQPPRSPVAAMDVALTLVPVVFLAGIRTFAAPCVHDDGLPATCAMAGHVMLGVALASIILVVMRLLSADQATKRSFDLLLVIAGVVVAVLPGNVVALCADTTMRCNVIMLPFARIAGACMSVAALTCELTVDHEIPTGRKRRR